MMVLPRPFCKIALQSTSHLNISENGNFPSLHATNFNCSMVVCVKAQLYHVCKFYICRKKINEKVVEGSGHHLM